MARPLPDSPSNFINRELSWLEFNRRVLEEASDQNNPLLERLKFLSISASNMDEFFEVRVASLVQQIEDGYNEGAADGLTLMEERDLINHETHDFVEEYCERELDPLLTPVTVDPAHPFPRVINKALCVAFLLRRRRRSSLTYTG